MKHLRSCKEKEAIRDRFCLPPTICEKMWKNVCIRTYIQRERGRIRTRRGGSKGKATECLTGKGKSLASRCRVKRGRNLFRGALIERKT